MAHHNKGRPSTMKGKKRKSRAENKKQRLIERINDPKAYAEAYLKIKTKEGRVAPLFFNSAQGTIWTQLQSCRKNKKPPFLIVLKGRQMGVSTFAEGMIMHDTATKRNRTSLIVAHDPEATEHIFNMAKFFYENLPDGIRPMKRYDNARRLVFENPDEDLRIKDRGLGSRIEVATANKVELRAPTIHNFHGSEVAFWGNAAKLMLAVMQTIPYSPETLVILESTANGVGGYFYDMFWEAYHGKNDFVAIFLAWFKFKEYELPLQPLEKLELTEDEEKLKKQFKLTDEKMKWRRYMIKNKCNNDINQFRQEYPCTPEEAFITSGTPKFNMENLRIYYQNKRAPLLQGELTGEYKDKRLVGAKVVKNTQGRLKIYEPPNPEHKYVIGGDVAKGTEHSDFSCLQVYDTYTGDFVATWHGKCDPTKFAYEAAMLGYLYKGADIGAVLGVEVNKDGITTNRVLYKEIRYRRLFFRKSVRAKTDKASDSLGFHTNETTRPVIINLLGDYVNNGIGRIDDETTLMEMMTFTIGDDGKPQAQEGCYDDAVIAAGIAKYLSIYAFKKPEEETKLEKHLRMLQGKDVAEKW